MAGFLKFKREAGVSMRTDALTRKADAKDMDAMEAVAHELIKCILTKDAEGVAGCLRSAFIIADSEPHHEGPHIKD